jgi:hypothetical protein
VLNAFFFVRYIVISVKNKKLGSYINELMCICSYFHVYIINVACKEVLPYVFML